MAFSVITASSASACTRQERREGKCPDAQAVANGGQVQLSAGRDTLTDGDTGSTNGDAGGGTGGGTATPPVNVAEEGVGGSHGGAAPAPAAPLPACPTCTAPIATSVSDLVGFSPQLPTQGMEPNGLAIVGLAANFVAEASAHVVSGTLLGNSAEVRFTPTAFRWDFGDGAGGTSANGGASWDDLGVPEFTDTDTSHIYTVRGDYVSSLSVEYSAEFRVGGSGWQSVTGTLAVAANPLPVVVRHVKSVLVAHDCIQNPAGIGC
ncbi:hypothetical protein GY21_18690 [Cryobacterium roopkundense]|uniref:PKD domain-containing protein n=1 Tax=Cryobacterium roopkundense TaxID=1001240 RepID=A0A099J3D1_9MICO|nr:hypothetical protein GY21_18690 [Cryobacterium roopkundense]